MYISIDTETYEQKEDGLYYPILNTNKFVIGCIIKLENGKKETFIFYQFEKLRLKLIELCAKDKKNKRKTYIYAHNMEYDWYAIMKEHLFDPEIKYILFNPFLAVFDSKAYILDTTTFFKMTLQQVGELIGKPKLEMPQSIRDPIELVPYVTRDTEIVLDAVMWLKKKLLDSGFNIQKMLTAGQVAMTAFLSYCRKNDLMKSFSDWDKEKKCYRITKTKYPELIRLAYRGGDNQAYKTGTFQNCTLLDKNGFYSEIMRDMRFCDLKSEIMIKEPSLNMLELTLNNEFCGIAQIEIESPTQTIPFLPIRYAEYQVFPSNTTMIGTWTLEEIRYAITLGYKIKKCYSLIRFKYLDVNPLSIFINHIYDLEKMQIDKINKIPFKMLRNNLSGKFAQNRKNKDYISVHRKDVMKYVELGYTGKVSFGENYIMIKETDSYDASYTNPIISARITALARIELHKFKMQIKPDDLLYCDTDSVIIRNYNEKYKDKFLISDNLGDWKIEEENKKCKILGEKRYYIGNRVMISGVNQALKSVNVIEREETVKVKRMIGINSALLNGKIEEVGTFNDFNLEMNTHNKMMLVLPNTINEVENGRT